MANQQAKTFLKHHLCFIQYSLLSQAFNSKLVLLLCNDTAKHSTCSKTLILNVADLKKKAPKSQNQQQTQTFLAFNVETYCYKTGAVNVSRHYSYHSNLTESNTNWIYRRKICNLQKQEIKMLNIWFWNHETD